MAEFGLGSVGRMSDIRAQVPDDSTAHSEVRPHKKPAKRPTTLYVPLQGFGRTLGSELLNRDNEKCRYPPFSAVEYRNSRVLPYSDVFRCFLNAG